MASVNKVILVGNLGRIRRSVHARRAAVATRMATIEVWTADGQRQEKTEWHRVCLGKARGSLQGYLNKGKQVYVEGRLQTRSWQDKEGKNRYKTEIKADRITLLGGGGGAAGLEPQVAWWR